MHAMQLKNNKGSAILMVTMLSLVSGGILFYLFMDSDFSYRLQKRLNDKTLYSHFIKNIKSNLDWPDQCYISLLNQVYNSSQSNQVVLNNFSYKNIPTSAINKNLKIGSGLMITDIILKRKPFNTFSKEERLLSGSKKKWDRNLSSEVTTKIAQLLITVKSHLNYSFKTVPINLFINVDPYNKIKSCYTALSAAYICESLKNSWNAYRSVCEPYKTCFYKSVNSCSLPYSLTSVGVGSYRVCQWCNSNRN